MAADSQLVAGQPPPPRAARRPCTTKNVTSRHGFYTLATGDDDKHYSARKRMIDRAERGIDAHLPSHAADDMIGGLLPQVFSRRRPLLQMPHDV